MYPIWLPYASSHHDDIWGYGSITSFGSFGKKSANFVRDASGVPRGLPILRSGRFGEFCRIHTNHCEAVCCSQAKVWQCDIMWLCTYMIYCIYIYCIYIIYTVYIYQILCFDKLLWEFPAKYWVIVGPSQWHRQTHVRSWEWCWFFQWEGEATQRPLNSDPIDGVESRHSKMTPQWLDPFSIFPWTKHGISILIMIMSRF